MNYQSKQNTDCVKLPINVVELSDSELSVVVGGAVGGHVVDLEAQLEKLEPTTEVGKALAQSLEGFVKVGEA